ncbi:MAG: N-acetyl sugar amidotransferase [Candidatus Peregrinibacteria bacterium]
MERHNTSIEYGLPEIVRFCTKCTISNQRPRITFDAQGVCSACRYAEYKRTVDWKLREKELRELCDRHRKNDGSFDVLVPGSGGKDGSYVAHQLREVYGMHPLAVTWSPLLRTDIGRQNLDRFVESGFNHILFTPKKSSSRLLTKLSFIHMADPFQPFIYGVYNFPLHISVKYNIPLIMYGENGEVEYGGDMKNAYKPTREVTDQDKHYFSGKPPEFWKELGVTDTDLYPYLPPSFSEIQKTKLEVHFYSYYKFWDPQENFYYSTQHTGFTANPERTEGTYSKYASLDDKLDGFHFWMAFIKFGIGRATSETAHEIRDDKITREEGVALVRKFDGEFPRKYFKDFLEYCDITEEQFWEVADSWRSPHLWDRVNEVWELKHRVS